MAKRFNLVRCSACGKVVGADHAIKSIERCAQCHSGKPKSKAKRTAASGFARTKKGPATDLGKLGQQNFRSSWERNFARWLVARKREWTFERVSFTFQFSPSSGKPYRKKPWVYIPDFHDVKADVLYEVKGYLRSEDRSKIRRLKANYPEDFRKLVAVCSKSNAKAIAFYENFGVPVLFIEHIKEEYESLVSSSKWEGR